MKVEPSRLADGGGKYCSNICKRNYRDKIMTTTCPMCSKTFRKRDSSQKYCSPSCGAKSRVVRVDMWRRKEPHNIFSLELHDLPMADRPGPTITAAGESMGLGYRIAV